MLHEVLVELIREAPRLLLGLLPGRWADADLAGLRFERDDPRYSQLVELEADLVLKVLGPADELQCAFIVEVQLNRDEAKQRSWPVYQAGVHQRLGCPVFLVVIAIRPCVATWATGPFSTGQMSLSPIVIGPRQVPVIADPAHARANVELALLSGLAHCRSPEAERIGEALWHALDDDPSEHRDLYWDLFLKTVNEATRRSLMLRFQNYRPQSEWGKRIYADGRLAGETASLLVLIDARRLAMTPEQRARIEACRERPRLLDWLRRAATAATLDEVFEPRPS